MCIISPSKLQVHSVVAPSNLRPQQYEVSHVSCEVSYNILHLKYKYFLVSFMYEVWLFIFAVWN